MSKKIDNSNNILEKFTKIVPYTPYICSSILGYYSYLL